jgi:hypothetical protein
MANLVLDAGTDFIFPGLGANLGKAFLDLAGWLMTVSSGGI